MATMSQPPRIVLASASPRRQALLRAGEVEFEVRVSGLDESPYHHPSAPRASALKTAMAKASAIAADMPRDTVVIGADTLVVLDEGAYAKPVDREDARRMLRRLSGCRHEVITGLAVQRAGAETLVDAEIAAVWFRELSDETIAAYVETGEADDKAGAYGIQGMGAELIADVQGDITCVIGLPLERLDSMYREVTQTPLFKNGDLQSIARRAFPDLSRLLGDGKPTRDG